MTETSHHPNSFTEITRIDGAPMAEYEAFDPANAARTHTIGGCHVVEIGRGVTVEGAAVTRVQNPETGETDMIRTDHLDYVQDQAELRRPASLIAEPLGEAAVDQVVVEPVVRSPGTRLTIIDPEGKVPPRTRWLHTQ